MTVGDYFECKTIVNDGCKNITNVGTLVGIFGEGLLMIQTEKFLLHFEKKDCRKMSDGEAMLAKLESE
jgi:hypothetical protein